MVSSIVNFAIDKAAAKRKSEKKLLLIGLDYSGKTTLLKQFS